MGSCKTNSPGSYRSVGISSLEDILDLWSHGDQIAALDRLHDSNRLVVLAGNFIALAGLNIIAVPIGVVDLELHKLHLGMLGQDLVQDFGLVMEGEANMLGDASFLKLDHVVPGIKLVTDLQLGSVKSVEQVKVKITRTCSFKGGLDEFFHILFFLDVYDGQFVGKLEALPGETLDNGFFCGQLGSSAAIDIGGVNIGKTVGEEMVGHFFDLFHINGTILVLRKAHKAKTQFGHVAAEILVAHFYILL